MMSGRRGTWSDSLCVQDRKGTDRACIPDKMTFAITGTMILRFPGIQDQPLMTFPDFRLGQQDSEISLGDPLYLGKNPYKFGETMWIGSPTCQKDGDVLKCMS